MKYITEENYHYARLLIVGAVVILLIYWIG